MQRRPSHRCGRRPRLLLSAARAAAALPSIPSPGSPPPPPPPRPLCAQGEAVLLQVIDHCSRARPAARALGAQTIRALLLVNKAVQAGVVERCAASVEITLRDWAGAWQGRGSGAHAAAWR